MKKLYCEACGGYMTNNIDLLREHQYECAAIRRDMVNEAIVIKGTIYPVGSAIDAQPLTVDCYDGVKFQADQEMSVLRMAFDFGPWMGMGRSTSIIERKI